MTKKVMQKSNKFEAKAVGTQVLVEMLNAQEALGTTLVVSGESKDTPQGIVLSIGPMVPEVYGLKKGDRVFFSSPAAVHPPAIAQTSDRKRACIDYNTIKGVLVN
jgi:hypothetical protein